MSTLIINPNATQNPYPVGGYTTDLSGYFYSFTATGGYFVQENFKSITVNPIAALAKVDTTNAIKVKIDYKYINSLLGFTYTQTTPGVYTINQSSDSYNDISGLFLTDLSDSISISAHQFRNQILDTSGSVISVGSLTTLYSDYYNTLQNTIFSNTSNYNSLSPISVPNSAFGYDEFYKLINGSGTYNGTTNVNSTTITDISGSISVNNISQTLRYSCDPSHNIFNNRTTQTVADGFQPGDLIYIQNGLNVKLNIGLNSNTGTSAINNFTSNALLNTVNVANNDYGTQQTTVISQLSTISRTVQVPIVIILDNLTPITGSTYVTS